MKKCTGCGNQFPVESFGWRDKKNAKRHARCNVCRRQYNKNWYSRSSAQQLDAVRKRMQIAQQWKFEYLRRSGGCVWPDCLVTNPIMLEFDHLDRELKTGEISRLVGRGASIERLEAEASKCRVLCANHHRLHTAQQFGTYACVELEKLENHSLEV